MLSMITIRNKFVMSDMLNIPLKYSLPKYGFSINENFAWYLLTKNIMVHFKLFRKTLR